MTKSAGFTLIELMIVVAIVILATIAIPADQGYIVNAQINRALDELSAYKIPFEKRKSSSVIVANNNISYTPSNLTNGSQAVNIGTLIYDGLG